MKAALVTLAHVCLSLALPPPHPRVLAARAEELALPPFLRSPALYNHQLQQVLPLSTLLHSGEMLVSERISDHISREQIYKVLSHAGLIPRTGGAGAAWPAQGAGAYDPFAAPPELLQYL